MVKQLSNECDETTLQTGILTKEIDETDNKKCIMGVENHLYPHISRCLECARSIKIIVSFIMESGVRLLENDFKCLLNKGKNIEILTGNYLNITQPSALYLLKDILGNNADIRFYSDKSRSFHPKAYIFQYDDGDGDIFIGSSNMSKSALTTGLEWNYRISKRENEDEFKIYLDEFDNLFKNQSIIVNEDELKRYSQQWVRPKLYKQANKDNSDKEISENQGVTQLFQPKGAQIEALYMLNNLREEGLDKALVVAATGIGKTYLAAFDSMKFGRILFVAHREEILKQAERTFKTIRPKDSTGFFIGDDRNTEANIIFASVQTIGKQEYLNESNFSRQSFDYIIIDEAHHSVSKNYRNIIDYFKPKFILGLTATPDRLDNKDVYALFDYNVAYDVDLKSSINKGWLVPFRYYGIYDDSIDYKGVEYKNGKYNEKQLQKALSIGKRAELIFKHYNKFDSRQALGFCVNKEHAEFMAEYFNANGIKACAVYSGELGNNAMYRNEALRLLREGNIKIIFSVDMFNEGLDIKSIDMVLFLRPTESPTVFLQQLGRGLRQDGEKEYLNVLDFIGNYKKANLIPFLLKGSRAELNHNTGNHGVPNKSDFPEDCLIDFDIKLIDIFEQMSKSKAKIEEIINNEFKRVMNELGKVPSRVEMLTYMDEEIYRNMKSKSKVNFFKDYIAYLQGNNLLSKDELHLVNTFAHEFINMIENTNMSKTYKMPVLLAFYNNGDIKMTINNDDIYESFREFYNNGSNGIDLARDKSTKNYRAWDKDNYVKLARKNPVKFLTITHKEFFMIDEDNNINLNEQLREFINNIEFKMHFKDAIDFRTKEFYKSRNI